MKSKLILASLCLFVSSAQACPEVLQGLKTKHLQSTTDVCAMADRYQAALNKMEQEGLRPADRAADLLAPRFINMPDWHMLGFGNKYNPWVIYKPAPLTWQKWESGLAIIEQMAKQNLAQNTFSPVTRQLLLQVQGSALKGLNEDSGTFRTEEEYGPQLGSHSDGLTAEQIAFLTDTYPSFLNPQTGIVEWHATVCRTDVSPSYLAAWDKKHHSGNLFDADQWPTVDPKIFFRDTDGKDKQCGYILYAKVNEIKLQLNAWILKLNSAMSGLNSGQVGDPIEIAARTQRWFVSIHPFASGNGRVSRFFMDLVLKSVGLPAPILKEMNDDVQVSKATWFDEVGAGIERAVAVAESCAANPKDLRCHIVPTTPPSISAQLAQP